MRRAGRRCSHLVAALVLAVACLAPSSAGAVSVDEYRRTVADLRREAAAAAGGVEAVRAAALATRVEAYVAGAPDSPVVVRDGSVAWRIDDASLRDLARRLARASGAQERRRAAGGLAAALASRERALGVPADPLRDDRDALRRLLTERLPDAGPRRSDWLGDQLRRLAQWFQELLGASATSPAVADARPWLIGFALVVLVVLAASVRGLVRLRARTRGPVRMGDEDAAGAPVVDAARDLPADPLTFADRLAADGRRREAMRALFGGAARTLSEAGLVGRARTRTDAEMLRDVAAAAPAAAPAFARLTERFELAWYGHRDPDQLGYDDARREFAEVARVATGTRAEGDVS